MGKKLTTEEFIERSKSVWGYDVFDYSKVEYKDYMSGVCLICVEHDEMFIQTPNSHFNGCIACSTCHLLKYGKIRIDIGPMRGVTKLLRGMSG